MQRHVFFISDGTGITAEQLGLSLISQFEGIEFIFTTRPYIDNLDKAVEVLEEIKRCNETEGEQPIVFITLIDPQLRSVFDNAPALHLNLFDSFIPTLEAGLGVRASGKTGRTHGMHNTEQYYARIEAINYTLATDDGLNPKDYSRADVILVGVSRSGKTPTSIYLALHFGIAAANYPMTAEDLTQDELPRALRDHASKCFGLTIDPSSLTQIREQRLTDSSYASLKQCTREIQITEGIFKQARIPYLNTTQLSVEEIATKIVAAMNLGRKII
jgi:[pyruvate, water dikinase]-phosphate phosphotransferase / [pyruvate, water dikinase] kinase